MSIEIVIARYKENLDWVFKIPEEYKIIIYNKGGNSEELNYLLKNNKNIIIRELENIGRESHTYLTHIINNYKNLSDKIIFTQGNPIEHNHDFIKLLKLYKQFDSIQPLSAYYIKNEKEVLPPEKNLQAMKKYWINDINIYVEYTNINFVPVYPYIYFNNIYYNINKIITTYNLYDYIKNILKIKSFNKKYLIPVFYTGIFSVDKNIVHKNNIDYYKRILYFLLYDKQIKNIDNGYIIERLWLSIFNYQKYSKNYLKINADKYTIYNKELKIKDNSLDFNVLLYNYIYLNIFINSERYKLTIYNEKIILSNSNDNETIIFNNSVKNKIKNKLHVQIKIVNEKIFIIINKLLLLKKNTFSTLKKCIIYDMLFYNELVDNNA